MRRKIALAPEVLEAVRGRAARHPYPIPPRAAALGYTPFDVEMGRVLALGLLAYLAEQVAPLFPEKVSGRELSPPATISDPPRQAVLDASSTSIVSPPADPKVPVGGGDVVI